MSDDAFESIGRSYLPAVMRQVAAKLVASGDLYAQQNNIPWSAQSNSIVAYLARHGASMGKDIAAALGQSPQLVGQKLAALRESGIIISQRDDQDRRRQIEALTPHGKQEFAKLKQLEKQASAAFGELFDEIGHDVWAILRQLDDAIDKDPFIDRINRVKRD